MIESLHDFCFFGFERRIERNLEGAEEHSLIWSHIAHLSHSDICGARAQQVIDFLLDLRKEDNGKGNASAISQSVR